MNKEKFIKDSLEIYHNNNEKGNCFKRRFNPHSDISCGIYTTRYCTLEDFINNRKNKLYAISECGETGILDIVRDYVKGSCNCVDIKERFGKLKIDFLSCEPEDFEENKI